MSTTEERADQIAEQVIAAYRLKRGSAPSVVRQAVADAAQIGLEEGMGIHPPRLVQSGPVTVFEDGHEPWDEEINTGRGRRWCPEHTRYEVPS